MRRFAMIGLQISALSLLLGLIAGCSSNSGPAPSSVASSVPPSQMTPEEKATAAQHPLVAPPSMNAPTGPAATAAKAH